jgi:hypothetical protein
MNNALKPDQDFNFFSFFDAPSFDLHTFSEKPDQQIEALSKYYEQITKFKDSHQLEVTISNELAAKLNARSAFKPHVQERKGQYFIKISAGEIRTWTELNPNTTKLALGFELNPDSKSMKLWEAHREEGEEGGFTEFGSISPADLLQINPIKNPPTSQT